MGGFRVLHPNIALSELVFKRVHLVPRRGLGGGNSPPKRASAGDKAIKARGGETAPRVYLLWFVIVVKGAKIFARFASKIFRRDSLTKSVAIELP